MDRVIEETKTSLENTRSFLERLEKSKEKSRRYIEEITNALENDLRRLERNANERPDIKPDEGDREPDA